jgi:hypothetical protein
MANFYTSGFFLFKMRSPSALSALISDPRGIPIAAFEDLNGGIMRNKDPETDSLGFYLTSPRSRKALLQAKVGGEVLENKGKENGSSERNTAQKSEPTNDQMNKQVESHQQNQPNGQIEHQQLSQSFSDSTMTANCVIKLTIIYTIRY